MTKLASIKKKKLTLKRYSNVFYITLICITLGFGQIDYISKTKGLLYGTLIGDALGGPIEFQPKEDVYKTGIQNKIWTLSDTINPFEIGSAKARLGFRAYSFLRPNVEPYAQWQLNAPPGTVTDDSRNKMVLMHMLRKKMKKSNKKIKAEDLAQAYLEWPKKEFIKSNVLYDSLSKIWLQEIQFAANWMLKIKKSDQRPPERMWNALPTCWGQMTTTPLASIYAGDTINAYCLAYSISFFDNAFARDMNAAIVAGLARAFALDPKTLSNKELWQQVISAMQNTDPYFYQKVPWSSRAVNKWLALADTMASQSKGRPAVLFDKLNEAFLYNEKWEAHVPLTVCFSILKMCDYDPLAALQMSIEWGWDTDTYPQLLGAFIGAIYGENIFKDEWRDLISYRLKEDYDEDIDEWTNVLNYFRLYTLQKKIYDVR